MQQLIDKKTFPPVLRSFLWVLLILISVTLMGPRVSRAADKVNLIIWGLESGEETKDQDAQIAEFEKRNPGVKVSALSMGAGAMNPQKLMTAIVGEVPPDLVRQDRFTVGDWASRGAFRSLNDFLDEDARGGDPKAIKQSDYVPATWSEVLYEGKTYGIPQDTDDRVLYYNKTMFRKAGLDPEKPPQTWSELISDAKKLTKRNAVGGFEQIGFIPTYGEGWLYLWSWQAGGELLSPDGRTCTLANPGTEYALKSIVDWWDALGGVDNINAFSGSFHGQEQDPLMTGKLAMEVGGDGIINSIARYHPEVDFGVCPVPVPDDRFNQVGKFKGQPKFLTWSGGAAWVIPQGAAHARAAWKFIQWMNSPEAALIGNKAQSEYVHGKGRLFVPNFSANRRATEAVFAKYKATLPPKFLKAKQTAQDLLPYTKFRPVTFVGQRLWDEHVRAVDQSIRHVKTPHDALLYGQQHVQTELDTVYNREAHPVLPMKPLVTVIVIIALIGFSVLGFMIAKWMRGQRRATRAEAWAGFGFVMPWIIGFLVFTVGPIIASLILSFCDYDVLHPARWAGVSNYVALATVDRVFIIKSIGNALYLALFSIPLGMMTSLAMAMLLNTKVKGQQFYRTAFYMPSIIPVIATVVLWAWILNGDPNRGLLNGFWQSSITPWSHISPPGWLSVPAWTKPSLILIGLWGAGGGMILWLAGLQSIPSTLYEAASLDGANAVAQFRHITLPMLSPYIFFNLIMGTIGALQTFETAYVLGNTGGGQTTGPDDSLLVPVIYLFNNAFQYFKMGYASALAWILFIIILGLTLGQLKMAPRWVHYETEDK
ncbi:MAG: extracellular solute-binding protein [Capsulimonas sp.]|uniref:extracellular solute-binding protein n=1 Tax=Capsulimonas sp. TaxID=2494211 RepID=UPI003267ED30